MNSPSTPDLKSLKPLNPSAQATDKKVGDIQGSVCLEHVGDHQITQGAAAGAWLEGGMQKAGEKLPEEHSDTAVEIRLNLGWALLDPF